MQFVKNEELKSGMRIARPIYNKKGVLLYDRGSKLTEAAISAVSNFGLIGIYILEPAEPIPPMTDEDIEFERFQAINVFALGDEMREIVNGKRMRRLEFIVNDILKSYGHRLNRINFIQNVRSHEDYVYKHSLNVAILAALMCHKMNASVQDTNDCVQACLVHDIGKTTVPPMLLKGESPEELERILDTAQDTGFEIVSSIFSSNPNIKRICAQSFKILQDLKRGREQEKLKTLVGTRVMLVAETFDTMTAMSVAGDKEPASSLEALRFMLSHPEVYHEKAVQALTDSVEILAPGTSVELSNGEKALVVTQNPGNLLRPMVLDFASNQLIDLSNRRLFDDLEIVDIVKKMDSRYVVSDEELRRLGIKK